MDPSSVSMPPQFLKSIAIHGMLLVAIFLLGRGQTQDIHERQNRVIESIRTQQELAEEEVKEEEAELAKEMLQDRLMERVEELIAEELEEQDENALLEKVEDFVEELLEERAETEPLDELSRDDLAALEDELRRDAFEQLKKSLEEYREEAIMAEVRRYAQEEVAPELKDRIESELKRRTGEEIKRALDESTRELKDEKGDNADRETRNAVANEAVDPIRDDIRPEVTKEIKEKAIPKVAQEITGKLAEHLKRAGMDDKTFNERAKDEIASALDQELSDRGAPNAEIATRMAADAFGAKDAQSLEGAKNAIDGAIGALKSASDKQEQIASDMKRGQGTDSGGEAADRQHSLAGEISSTMADASEALRGAMQNSSSSDGQISQALKATRGNQAGKNAEQAADALASNDSQGAAGKMNETSRALNDTINGLSNASSALGREIAEAQKASASAGSQAPDLAASLGEGAAKSAVANAVAAGSKAAAKSIPGSVGNAAGQMRVGSGLSDQDMHRLGLLGGLKDKLAQIEQNIASGRDMGSAGMGEGPSVDGTDASAASPPGTGNGPKTGGLGKTETQGQGTGTGPTASLEGATGRGSGAGAGKGQGASNGKSGGGVFTVASNSHGSRFGPGYNGHARYNREIYKMYKELMSTRKGRASTSAPLNEGGDVIEVNSAGSVAGPGGGLGNPGIVFVNSAADLSSKENSNIPRGASRSVPEPSFKYLAFGAAPLQRKPLRIDGDVSDWGELEQPMRMMWSYDDKKLEDGIPVYMRWNSEGLYFCYRVNGRTKIEPNTTKPYEGDCFEVWLDVDNLRKDWMGQSQYSQQFCLMPFGFTGKKNITFAEIGRGFRGILRHSQRIETSTDIKKALGKAAARMDDDGYTVEAFISIKALAKPRIRAGTYVAMNFSVNQGYDYAKGTQWSLSKAQRSFDRPDTWGDVLLLGSDASAKFTGGTEATDDKQIVVPGTSMTVEVSDEDMNVDARRRDKVLAQVRVEGRASMLYVILDETGHDTGVFRGSFDTQPMHLPRKLNTLNVGGGNVVQLVYKDSRAKYGEVNRRVDAKRKIGLPVYKLGSK